MHCQLLREMRPRHLSFGIVLVAPALVMTNSRSNYLAVLRFLWRKN
jgi:hypothetical protein